MAIWRPLSMDSWNPLSLGFWSLHNLVGQTTFETLKQTRARYIATLKNQMRVAHPTDLLPNLLCPLSIAKGSPKLLLDAVITKEGQVFNGNDLSTYLQYFKAPPGANTALSTKDIYPFDELQVLAKRWQGEKIEYKKAKKRHLEEAQQALKQAPKDSNTPAIFLCSLSKRLMQKPVLLPTGVLCERSEIIKMIEDGDMSNLSTQQLRDFPQFETLLNRYLLSLMPNQKSMSSSPAPPTDYSFMGNIAKTLAKYTGFSYFFPAQQDSKLSSVSEQKLNSSFDL